MPESAAMTFGPLELEAYLRRRKSRDSARDAAGDAPVPLAGPENQLTVISGPPRPTPMPREADALCADVLEEMAQHSPPARTPSD
jgi:hypothetical protein